MSRYSSFDEKYQALVNRDPNAEGNFIYCVKSTKIFCRPTCFARLALKKNIFFCDNIEEASQYGYLPCKRCKPEKTEGWNRTRDLIMEGCRCIMQQAQSTKVLNMEEITSELRVSKWHFYRKFKIYTGLTPRKFYLQCRRGNNPLSKRLLPDIVTKKNTLLEKEKKAQMMKSDNCTRDDFDKSVERIEIALFNEAILEDPFFNEILGSVSHSSENLSQETIDQLIENVQ